MWRFERKDFQGLCLLERCITVRLLWLAVML